MNKAKLQIELFKKIVTREQSVAYANGEDEIYFSMDGFSAFSVQSQDVCLDISKVKNVPSIATLFSLCAEDVEVRETNFLRSVPGGFLFQLQGENFSVWVNRSPFDRYYDKHKLFCKSAFSPVKLVNQASGKIEAIVLPVRVTEDGNA